MTGAKVVELSAHRANPHPGVGHWAAVSAADFAALVEQAKAAQSAASWLTAKAIAIAAERGSALIPRKRGGYRAWAAKEFGISERTAEDLRAVYRYVQGLDPALREQVQHAPWTKLRDCRRLKLTEPNQVLKALGLSKRELAKQPSKNTKASSTASSTSTKASSTTAESTASSATDTAERSHGRQAAELSDDDIAALGAKPPPATSEPTKRERDQDTAKAAWKAEARVDREAIERLEARGWIFTIDHPNGHNGYRTEIKNNGDR